MQLLLKEPACQWLVSRAGKAAALSGSLDRHRGVGGVCFSGRNLYQEVIPF